MEKRKEMEFDLVGAILYLRKKIWIILLVAVTFAVGGYIGAKALMSPQYTASTRIYVYRTDATGVDYSGLQTATQLRRDCAILITGTNVTEEVVERLGLKMSPSALSSRISVDSQENTRILQLSYSDTDPERAALIINTVREVATEQIKNIMKMDVVSTVYEADVPTAPSSPGASYYGMLAAVVGAVLTVIVLVIVFVVDDTIRTEEHVTRYLGLSTLAAVPASMELGTAKGIKDGRGSHSLLHDGKK